MISTEQAIELEILVRKEIEQLEKELVESAMDSEAISPDNAIGRLSRQDSMLQQELAKEGARRRQLRLKKLRNALERMDNATFGICENCDGDIDFGRLCAAPESTICADCAGK